MKLVGVVVVKDKGELFDHKIVFVLLIKYVHIVPSFDPSSANDWNMEVGL